jgi:hypothetical protein
MTFGEFLEKKRKKRKKTGGHSDSFSLFSKAKSLQDHSKKSLQDNLT